MPETYDPQQRTFIKKPENKICAACGQPIQEPVKPMSNHMNSYIANVEGAKPMIVNSNEETLTLNSVIVYKINPATGKANFPKPVIQTPVAPAVVPLGNTPKPPTPTPAA